MNLDIHNAQMLPSPQSPYRINVSVTVVALPLTTFLYAH